MKIFNLPDLGEGLPDAEIREWYVKVGDEVKADQPLAAMETAKALVDVPSPYSGKIAKLFGNPGDTIETGQPLIGFEGEGKPEETETESETEPTQTTGHARIKATPAVKMLAKQLGVDLATITPRGTAITVEDVKAAAQSATSTTIQTLKGPSVEGQLTPLSKARRAMAMSMTQSHQSIVPVTLCDDADIHAWKTGEDITVRLIRAVQSACQEVPMLNAHFDSEKMSYKKNDAINLGIAVDTPHGLYVPVIKEIAKQKDAELRENINRFKQQAQDKSIPQEDLHGATIMLSNYGAFAGRYANPVIVPPMVAIIGVGKSRDEVVPENGKPAIHKIMPLSVTIDHRAVTGGEAARFLKALIDALQT